jgi:predicted N-acetyltransferase YhbS
MSALLAPPGAPLSPAPRLKLAVERPEDAAGVDALVDAAFGPGRYAKTAERLRERNRRDAACSFVATCGAELVGSVRLWPVSAGGSAALFLGPIAVASHWRRRGLGALLVERACEAAASHGHGLVLLVGDRPFFGPLGFTPVPKARLALPGPVNPGRVLWRELRPGAAAAVAGPVAPCAGDAA